MADTIRTKTALLALYPVGNANAISAQDLRDAVVSILGCYGAIRFQGNAATQTIAAATPEVLTEWTHDGLSNGTTPAFASDQITILTAGVYEVTFTCSFQGVATKIHEFELRIDGAVTNFKTRRYTSSNDVGSCSFCSIVTLAANEVLTVWVEGTGNGNIVVEEGSLCAKRIG